MRANPKYPPNVPYIVPHGSNHDRYVIQRNTGASGTIQFFNPEWCRNPELVQWTWFQGDGLSIWEAQSMLWDLVAAMTEPKPRFDNVSCSQCGQEFGPGDHGFSHCEHHQPAVQATPEVDSYSKHELMDRAAMAQMIVHEMLDGHPALTPSLNALLEMAIDSLGRLYQEAGTNRFDYVVPAPIEAVETEGGSTD